MERYSYVLNNPVKFIDPLGLYEFDKSVDPKQRGNFRTSLKQAQDNLAEIKNIYGDQSNEYKKAKAAVEFYGCEKGPQGCSEAQGNNGVVVAVSAQDKGAEGSTGITGDGKMKYPLLSK